MKKFYIGVKAVIRTEKGILLLRHESGYWDMPGGRIDDNERFEEALAREITEELPGSTNIVIGKQLGTYRIERDIEADLGLVLVFFEAHATLVDPLVLSDEHETVLWVAKVEDIPEDITDIVKQNVLAGLNL